MNNFATLPAYKPRRPQSLLTSSLNFSKPSTLKPKRNEFYTRPLHTFVSRNTAANTVAQSLEHDELFIDCAPHDSSEVSYINRIHYFSRPVPHNPHTRTHTIRISKDMKYRYCSISGGGDGKAIIKVTKRDEQSRVTQKERRPKTS